MNKQAVELVERVRLTDRDFVEWCDSHTVKGCNTTRTMIYEGEEVRKVFKCEDCRAEAQLNKALDVPDLYQRVEHQNGHYLNGTWQPSVRVEYISLADELKEVRSE